jgi:aspartyl-tRNA(Asn)/glutamyl-tRNA(Gln) amidotransferase subunit B
MTEMPVIGLEVHVQLKARAKLFCSCPTDFGAPPNSRVCPVCLGLPGALPIINNQAVLLAVRGALALGAEVSTSSTFDRKHYFYPDLPKGYQVSQNLRPLAHGGRVPTPMGQVDLLRIHIEEDAGKLSHTEDSTLIDYNRSGQALLEIVTAPCLSGAKQARVFLEILRRALVYAGVCDGRLEEGSMRCDANLSLGGGGRVEIKNLNSFRGVEKALAYELERQSRARAEGRTVLGETRRWDEAGAATRVMRTKGQAQDYWFLPEPDLPPLVIGADLRRQARGDLPEMPWTKEKRFTDDYGLSPAASSGLTKTRTMADYFEAVVAAGCKARQAANFLLGEGSKGPRGAGLPSPGQLALLLCELEQGRLSPTGAKAVFARMLTGETAREALRAVGSQLTDREYLEKLAAEVVAANPKAKADYLGGRKRALGFFIGAAMAASGGRAHPALLRKILVSLLTKNKV